MGEELIHTDVDRLVDILKGKGKMEISHMAKELGVPEKVVQEWVDFLVEENIIGLDYNFTKPSIYAIEEKQEKLSKTEFQKYKQDFQENAQKQSGNKEYVWRQHILEKLEFMKHFFYKEAEQRRLENVDELWEEYKEKATEQ